MVPASGDAHKNFHSPLAGIRSRTNSSACGNAIKILHPRKRRFCHYFSSQSPRADVHIKMYIPPLREYNPEPIVPLAEMQSKYCTPASRDFVIISIHGPRDRICSLKFYIPPCRNTIQNRQFHLRKCPRKRRFCNYFSSRSPRAEMHIKIYIFPSRE